MTNLEIHAERELRRARLFDKDSDYDRILGPAIMNLIVVSIQAGRRNAGMRMRPS